MQERNVIATTQLYCDYLPHYIMKTLNINRTKNYDTATLGLEEGKYGGKCCKSKILIVHSRKLIDNRKSENIKKCQCRHSI